MEERKRIPIILSKANTMVQIAERLDRPSSTIGREMNRNLFRMKTLYLGIIGLLFLFLKDGDEFRMGDCDVCKYKIVHSQK
jgi:hypothetical protein